ncbi:hypothetical protein LINPERPRIM_LOCUS6539 [Linum perenne]
MPAPMSDSEDLRIWSPSNNGRYSVKSAYRLWKMIGTSSLAVQLPWNVGSTWDCFTLLSRRGNKATILELGFLKLSRLDRCSNISRLDPPYGVFGRSEMKGFGISDLDLQSRWCELGMRPFENGAQFGHRLATDLLPLLRAVTRAVARGVNGEWLGLKQEIFPRNPPARECEAKAMLMAIRWAAEGNLTDVCFETDCQELVFAIRSDEEDVSEFGVLVGECRRELSSFLNTTVLFTRRNGNQVADAVARRSVCSVTSVWGGYPPGWLVCLLDNICLIQH